MKEIKPFLTKYLAILQFKLILSFNKFRFNFQIQRKGKFFKIIIPTSYKKWIDAIKIILTVISLLSALYEFSSVIIAFIVGLIFYLLISLLNKIIFSYSSIYVHPFPEFEILNEKWRGVSFGYGRQEGNPHDIPMIGLLFDDEEYANNVYSLLQKWSYGKKIDEEKNIVISVISDTNDSYVFSIYPSFYRESAQLFYKEVENSISKDSSADIHQPQFFIFVLGKKFPISTNSYYTEFKNRYQEGVPFLLDICILENGKIRKAKNIEDMVLFSLKFKDKNDLDRKDIEYDLFKLIPLAHTIEQ